MNQSHRLFGRTIKRHCCLTSQGRARGWTDQRTESTGFVKGMLGDRGRTPHGPPHFPLPPPHFPFSTLGGLWVGWASYAVVGAGIAQWLEHRTRDWKVAGSNPCWNGERIFFSRVDFLCWLLFRYPFHPRVTTVARKKSWSFCQKCRWQVTAKHAYTLRMWILLNRASALVTTCP